MATGFTRTQYREAVAQIFGLHTAAATGGSTTTVVDSKLSRFADDYFNGLQVYIKAAGGAAPAGETAWVTDFVSSTGTLTISPALTAAVESGDTYQIYFRVTKDDIDEVLNTACAGYEVATSLTPKDNSLDYYITAAPLLLRRGQIIGVWARVNNDVQNRPQQVLGWHLEEAEGQLVLRMPWTMNTSDALWLVYYAAEHTVAETDTMNLPVALVRARCAVHLLENKLNNSTDRDWHGTQIRYWAEKLRVEEGKMQRAIKRTRLQNWTGDGGGEAFVTDQSWLGHIAVDTGAHLIAE